MWVNHAMQKSTDLDLNRCTLFVVVKKLDWFFTHCKLLYAISHVTIKASDYRPSATILPFSLLPEPRPEIEFTTFQC